MWRLKCNLFILFELICFACYGLSSCGGHTGGEPPSKTKDTDSVASGTLTSLDSQLSNDIIYSKNIYIIKNTAIQGFDIDADGTIYYDQLGDPSPQYIYIVRAQPNKSYTDYMQLKYFGHGTNMVMEKEGDKNYIWIDSNGSKSSDGSYTSSQTFSRIEYAPDSIIENYGGDTYYLSDERNIHPAIDFKNDVLAVTTSGGKDGNKRRFYFYKLSAAEALPLTTVTLSSITYGGEESGKQEQTVTRKLDVKDLGNLTPIAFFELSPGGDSSMINYYSFQGFDISNGKLYFLEGDGNDNNVASGPSNAYVTVLSYNGRVLNHRTKVKAIYEISALNEFGITATGYMEAEGIKKKSQFLYVGLSSKSTNYKRLANIFKYKCK
jgi:hypothetical protein